MYGLSNFGKLEKSDLYGKYDYTLLSAGDVVSSMATELRAGQLYLRLEDGKIDSPQPSMEWNIPWVFAEKAPERECVLWHRIMYGKFGMLPIWCRKNCWKIVVRPRTLEELFMLKELQEHTKVPSKCGVETRGTVFGNYGGYFYTNSKEEGLDRLDRVRAEVGNHISPGIPVYLKLACTEFEHTFGPSTQYKEPTIQEHKNEDTIRGCFISLTFDSMQPKHLKDYICQKWIHFAWDRGDPTARMFNKNESLFPDIVKYEKEDDLTIKQALPNTPIAQTQEKPNCLCDIKGPAASTI